MSCHIFRNFLDFFPIFPLIYNYFLNFRKTGRFIAETARFLDKTARFSLYRKPKKPSGFCADLAVFEIGTVISPRMAAEKMRVGAGSGLEASVRIGRLY